MPCDLVTELLPLTQVFHEIMDHGSNDQVFCYKIKKDRENFHGLFKTKRPQALSCLRSLKLLTKINQVGEVPPANSLI